MCEQIVVPEPQCVGMCPAAFSNFTLGFGRIAGGVLGELRDVVDTLEHKFDLVSLDRQFDLVDAAIADKLRPLKAQSDMLAAKHAENLRLIKVLHTAFTARQARAASFAAVASENTSSSHTFLAVLGGALAFAAGMFASHLIAQRGGAAAVAESAARAATEVSAVTAEFAAEAANKATSHQSRQYTSLQ